MTESGDDKPIPLSRMRAQLARPRGARRIEALISTKDPEAAVQALSIPELYFTVREAGMEDAYDLVALASTDQIEGCLDIDVWDRDQFQLAAALPWITALIEAGYDKVGQVFRAMDPEFAALTLQRMATIYDASLGEDLPEDSDLPAFTTVDRFFHIEMRNHNEDEVRVIHRLVEDLYRHDMALAHHVLMSARSELPSYLEETSYRFRSGRMADLGYVDFYDALEVFRPIDPTSVQIGEDTADKFGAAGDEEAARTLPATMLEQVVGRAFLARALSHLRGSGEAERIEAALLVLVNKVLAAARVSPGDEDAVRIGTEHATATLALGLEIVSARDDEKAAAALRTIALTRLHRLGYSATLRLARLAKMLAPRATTAGPPTDDVLAAVLSRRPFFPEVLDGSGVDRRPFESTEDLAICAAHLSEVATRIAIATALGVDLVAVGELDDPPALDDHARTALLRLESGAELDAAPLSQTELEAGTANIAKLAAEGARKDAASAFERLLEGGGVSAEAADSRVIATLVSRWTDELADTLGGLSVGIDPRFVTGVVLRSTKS